MNTIEENAPERRRRRHSGEFKAKAVHECMRPDVSIAAVALRHRLNANLLRRWVAEQEELDAAAQARELMAVPQAEFIPLQIGEPAPPPTIPEIRSKCAVARRRSVFAGRDRPQQNAPSGRRGDCVDSG